jgi:hypothetical protein
MLCDLHYSHATRVAIGVDLMNTSHFQAQGHVAAESARSGFVRSLVGWPCSSATEPLLRFRPCLAT